MGFVLLDGRKLTREMFEDGKPTLVQIGMTRNEVRNQDFSRLYEVLDAISEIGRPAKSTLVLTFDGWDFDKRTLAEIPEVSQYIKRVVEDYPHIWYFLLAELTPYIFVSLVPYTMYSSPLFPKPVDTPPDLPNEKRLVQFDLATASKQIDTLVKAVLTYGVTIKDQSGALEVTQTWRSVLNL
jgi:hypothetical protein